MTDDATPTPASPFSEPQPEALGEVLRGWTANPNPQSWSDEEIDIAVGELLRQRERWSQQAEKGRLKAPPPAPLLDAEGNPIDPPKRTRARKAKPAPAPAPDPALDPDLLSLIPPQETAP